MLKIRLVRIGKKNAPAFKIMANLEVLGSFNPQTTPPKLQLDKERVDYWTKHGAQLSPAISQLLKGKYEFKPYVPNKKEVSSQESGRDQKIAISSNESRPGNGRPPAEGGTDSSKETVSEPKPETTA